MRSIALFCLFYSAPLLISVQNHHRRPWPSSATRCGHRREATDRTEKGEEHEISNSEGDANFTPHLAFQTDQKAERRRQAEISK